jgi:hypothetical protein
MYVVAAGWLRDSTLVLKHLLKEDFDCHPHLAKRQHPRAQALVEEAFE